MTIGGQGLTVVYKANEQVGIFNTIMDKDHCLMIRLYDARNGFDALDDKPILSIKKAWKLRDGTTNIKEYFGFAITDIDDGEPEWPYLRLSYESFEVTSRETDAKA